ncbi:hypothetical protein [Streptomyces sp. ISL-100]|uniref:hypothetical protein n=1 Tax=Streptomyces sp. ISL-100 TaxID=2819173 RepID=UPI001BED3B07|nr:hypothetical protein [Streptomyces sp. ISL-100]MBT2398811.1 hypothetical protein [Streptomyces sp. ISL-100]
MKYMRSVALASASLLLAGCGIRASEVIEAGGPAVVDVAVDQQEGMLLFFVGPDGSSIPVARFVDAAATPVATAKKLAALLHGPTPEEQAAGITTRLPTDSTPVQVEPATDEKASSRAGARKKVHVTVAFPVRSLDAAAVRQLVCTTAHAEDPEGLVKVALTGSDGALSAAGCD